MVINLNADSFIFRADPEPEEKPPFHPDYIKSRNFFYVSIDFLTSDLQNSQKRFLSLPVNSPESFQSLCI